MLLGAATRHDKCPQRSFYGYERPRRTPMTHHPPSGRAAQLATYLGQKRAEGFSAAAVPRA